MFTSEMYMHMKMDFIYPIRTEMADHANLYSHPLFSSVAGNLPHSATAAQVLELLGLSSGKATVELATARENPAKKLGFGFVTVPVEHVEAVLQCNRTQMGGRTIKGMVCVWICLLH